MKFSALTVASVAVVISAAAAALSENTLKTVVENEIQSTVHARRVMMEKTMQSTLRQLQDTACDAAFAALLEDEALAAATAEYIIAYEATASNLDISNCDIGDTSATCDFTKNAPSTTELSSACTAQGGTLEGFDSNVACTVTADGQTVSFYFDFPPLYLCIPTVEGEDCKAEAQATSDQVDDDIEADMENGLSLAGLPSTCDVGPDVQTAAGNSSARGFAALAGAAVTMAFLLM